MKILIIGNVEKDIKKSYSWFVKTTYDGLSRLGHDIYGLDWKKSTIEKIWDKVHEIKPDVIFTHLTFHADKPLDLVMDVYSRLRKKFGLKIIHTIQDARHEPRYDGDISNAFDFALVGQNKNLKKFSNYWKIPTYYFPYSCLVQDELATPLSSLKFKEPVFTGTTVVHQDRIKFIKELKSIMKIKVFVTKSKGDIRHLTPELSVSAHCILGLCTGYDIDGYIDVRPFQYLGSGAFMIMRKFKNMDKMIPPDLYYPFDSYDNPQEVLELYNKSLKDDTRSIGEKAFKYMQENHSSVIRMKEVMRYL